MSIIAVTVPIIVGAILSVGLMVWNLVLILQRWTNMKTWARVLYLTLLFSGVGPVLSIILLYCNVGICVDGLTSEGYCQTGARYTI